MCDMDELERRIKQESSSQVIDPKILGLLWNELPAGSHENYKLKFSKGEAAANPVNLASESNVPSGPVKIDAASIAK